MKRTYTVERLARRGARHAFALLLQHVRDGDEPFVTYGAIAQLLQRKLRIPIVFPTHVGAVAGALMDQHRCLRDLSGARTRSEILRQARCHRNWAERSGRSA